MQQKYGTVLANKTPEVQEANLGDKGNFNRLLVGPPGSRASATQLCTELKAAGYKDCWVAAY
jgi:cell division septation protein DedD